MFLKSQIYVRKRRICNGLLLVVTVMELVRSTMASPIGITSSRPQFSTKPILSPSVHSGTFETRVKVGSKTQDAMVESTPSNKTDKIIEPTSNHNISHGREGGGNVTTPVRLLVQSVRRSLEIFSHSLQNATTGLRSSEKTNSSRVSEIKVPVRVRTATVPVGKENDTQADNNSTNSTINKKKNEGPTTTEAWLHNIQERTTSAGAAAREWTINQYTNNSLWMGRHWKMSRTWISGKWASSQRWIKRRWTLNRKWMRSNQGDGTRVRIVIQNDSMVIGQVDGGELAGTTARPPARASAADNGNLLVIGVAVSNGTVIEHRLTTGNSNVMNVSRIMVRPDDTGYAIVVPRSQHRNISANERKNATTTLGRGWSAMTEEDEVEFLTSQLECQKLHGVSGIRRMLCTCTNVHDTHVGKRLLCVARVADKVVRAANQVGASDIAQQVRLAAVACRKQAGGITAAEACLTSALVGNAGHGTTFHSTHGRSILTTSNADDTTVQAMDQLLSKMSVSTRDVITSPMNEHDSIHGEIEDGLLLDDKKRNVKTDVNDDNVDDDNDGDNGNWISSALFAARVLLSAAYVTGAILVAIYVVMIAKKFGRGGGGRKKRYVSRVSSHGVNLVPGTIRKAYSRMMSRS